MEGRFSLRDLLIAAGGAAAGVAVAFCSLAQRRRSKRAPRRFGGACRLRPDMYNQYTRLHDHTWDEVMERMYRRNMRNFVVYLHEETNIMFSHWEYVGDNLEADMKAMDSDPLIRFWWSHCEPCQEPFHWTGPPPSQGGCGGNWWAPLKLLNSCGAWPVDYSCRWPDPDFEPVNPTASVTTYEGAMRGTLLPPLVHNRKGD
eukprot:TRINITY_DN61422_c0_g1_i1.p2 TRINITY_DN61422_c0_g1~~TRINITY_DN61422_c0_g1_i1.p2  ORF type:complete len:226 (+),score=90.08 TRINITY_DN61422_c0_g1_i1:76-678(+)